jgi:mRNA interferase MazF
MTEQVRTISRARIVDTAGRADAETLRAVRGWIRDFLET